MPKSATVIGAGLAGLSTAVYLAEEGLKVTVIEANSEVGLESSFMNGALVVPSLTQPWCNPNNIKMFIKDTFGGSLPGRYESDDKSVDILWGKVARDVEFWKWLMNFAYFSLFPGEFYRIYKLSYELSRYSQDCLENLLPKHQLSTSRGTIQLYSTERERQAQFDVLRRVVGDVKVLQPAEVMQLEPVFRNPALFPGGALHSALDTSMDVHALCLALKEKAMQLGVRFAMNTNLLPGDLTLGPTETETETGDEVNGASGGKRIEEIVVTTAGTQNGSASSMPIGTDVYVVCTGNHSNLFSDAFGDSWHSWPVRGLAMEVPLLPDATPLVHNVVDDVRRNYIAPVGTDRVRLSGYVEIGERLPVNSQSVSFDRDKTSLHILKQARSLLPPNYLVSFDPKSGDTDVTLGVKTHACYRPQTADDLPVIGRSKNISNLYYNSGHGHLGLTRAVGSSRLLTNLIIGKTITCSQGDRNDEIDIGHFDPARFEFSVGKSRISRCLHIFK